MNQQYKRITRTLLVPCPTCLGTCNIAATTPFHAPCTTCNGTGEVSRTINELVPVTGDEDNEVMLGWAGSVV